MGFLTIAGAEPLARQQCAYALVRRISPLQAPARPQIQPHAPVAPPSATLSSESFRVTRSLPHGRVEAVLRVVRTLGLDRVLGSKLSPERNLALAIMVARILDPGSKLATARSLDCQTLSSTLAEECHLEGSIHENELYAAMDWLVSRQARIEKALAARHLEEGYLALYDLTSSHLEGQCCELARLGFNRDGKKGKLQMEYGLLCNREGCPVGGEVFAGNTAEPMTLGSQIKKVRERFGLRRLVIVGDRGMIVKSILAKMDAIGKNAAIAIATKRGLIEAP